MAPDTASVTLGVTIVETTLKDAQAKASAQMDAIIAALKAEGVKNTDIQTSSYSVAVDQTSDSQGTPGEITGYTVTVRQLASLGPILDQVVAQGANSIWGIAFSVADQTAAAKQARELAVKDAIQGAAQIAAAAGGAVGKIVAINELYSPAPSGAASGAQMTGGQRSAPIQAGTTTVTASVTITFAFVQ